MTARSESGSAPITEERQLAPVGKRRPGACSARDDVRRGEHEPVRGDDDGAAAADLGSAAEPLPCDAEVGDRGRELLGDAAHDPRIRVERLVVVRPLSLVASGCLRSERRADERQRSHDLTVAADASAADSARMAVVAGARPSIQHGRLPHGRRAVSHRDRRRASARGDDDSRATAASRPSSWTTCDGCSCSSRAGMRTCTAAS